MAKNINSQVLEEFIQEGNCEIIDVRESEEYVAVRIKNSKLLPLGEIMERLQEIDWNKKVVLVCRSGARSFHAASLISGTGKDVWNLEGGILGLDQNFAYLER